MSAQSADGEPEASGDRRTLLFVYGTLRRAGASRELVGDGRFVGEARTLPEMSLFDLGWHPAMVLGGRTSVVGDVVEVGAATLEALDAYEEHPAWYVRTTIRLADGRQVSTYLLPPERLESDQRIESGDWLAHVAARST